MEINQAGINLIKQFEGCKLTAYLDSVNILTIGYGHTGVDFNGEPIALGMVITQEEAIHYLQMDLEKFSAGVSKLTKTIMLTSNQFSALVSFAYNLGLNNLKNSTLLQKIQAGDFAGAADEFPKWNRAGGAVLAGLTKRRAAEQALFLTPD